MAKLTKITPDSFPRSRLAAALERELEALP